MARYVTTVRTAKTPKWAFTYDADLRLNGVLRVGDWGLRLAASLGGWSDVARRAHANAGGCHVPERVRSVVGG